MSNHNPSIGYQLYSARLLAENNLQGVLESIGKLGYHGVEFAGFYGHSAKDVRKMLKVAGLKAASSHLQLHQLRTNAKEIIKYHQELNCPYLSIAYLPEGERPGDAGFSAVLRDMYRFGRLCRKEGLSLLYHNHDFEFVELSGQSGLDFLFDAIPAKLLQTEIDTCWVRYAGVDPTAYLHKYTGRAPIVHLKDFIGTRSERPPYSLIGLPEIINNETVPFQYLPLGHGIQDVPSLWLAAKKCGAQWVIVEQDDPTDSGPLEDARLSIETLQSLLQSE